MSKETIIRNYFKGWENADRVTVEAMLDDSFTFTSPVDDRINKAEFFAKCWVLSSEISRLTVDKVLEKGEEAYVTYTSIAPSGGSVRCTEHFEFIGNRIKNIDVFGGSLLPDW